MLAFVSDSHRPFGADDGVVTRHHHQFWLFCSQLTITASVANYSLSMRVFFAGWRDYWLLFRGILFSMTADTRPRRQQPRTENDDGSEAISWWEWDGDYDLRCILLRKLLVSGKRSLISIKWKQLHSNESIYLSVIFIYCGYGVSLNTFFCLFCQRSFRR